MRALEKSAHACGWVVALWILAAAPAAALQVLEAVDHAELAAEVSSGEVNRIALEHDRIARVVQSAGSFTLEHDPARGDLYLYPVDGGAVGRARSSAPQAPGALAPVTLYLGTEKGLTYRLTLTPVDRDSAQILIRNQEAAATAGSVAGARGSGRDSEIVALIGSVARREPLPGYAVHPAANVAERQGNHGEPPRFVDEPSAGTRLLETWRGPAWTVRVLEVSDAGIRDASALTERFGPGAVAAWLQGPGPADGSLAVGGPADSKIADRRSADGRSEDGPQAPRLGVVVEAAVFNGAGP